MVFNRVSLTPEKHEGFIKEPVSIGNIQDCIGIGSKFHIASFFQIKHVNMGLCGYGRVSHQSKMDKGGGF